MTKLTISDIKDCPHCTGAAELAEWCGFYYVECTSCSMSGPKYATEHGAIKAWNELKVVKS